MKVLIIKTSSMGDIIHTLPALSDAQQAIPDIRFDWVVEEAFQEIPGWHNAVDQVIPIAIRRWRKSILKTLQSGEWGQYKAKLQATPYDAIIDAQGLLKSALLATRLAKGPKFGLDRSSAREPLAARFYDHPISVAKNQHAVERVRQLFASALEYQFNGQGNFSIHQHFVAEATDSPYLVFQHSTTRFDKHWPEEYWKALISKACSANWKIKLPWGNTLEKERAERLASIDSRAEVLPRMNLSEVANVLAGACACVSVDTGLSHLAAALDRPNVILFGPTDPGLVGGYGRDQYCLKASDYPNNNFDVEPAIFAPLTPEIVWQTLSAKISRPMT
ncbi:MAG: lipopolysaccharide heptosyltransferase RfaC [Neptuniibacter sp.]